ncbi:hypothetical protein [Saccharopolyspora elongata]|uniref:hypothetical protein n=1 Tax=Saccharopolyspora elongata TaxID=2530387 RepID=UPI001404BA06|nr:hypothetical protein [Saccharopolyspora elongata]
MHTALALLCPAATRQVPYPALLAGMAAAGLLFLSITGLAFPKPPPPPDPR